MTLAVAPHRLIDIRDPHQTYSAAEFRNDALCAMREITRSGRIPLLVGGTGLYFRALLHGMSDMPEADTSIRTRIEADAARDGWDALHAELQRIDPVAGRRIHASDTQRIQRALEVWHLTGRPISDWQQSTRRQRFPWRVLRLIVAPRDRQLLHQRIEKRFDAMLQSGLLDEVAGLRDDPRLHPDLPSMRAVGYRQAWEHLQGQSSLPEMRDRGIAATRQLAKRQWTWLRSQLDARWFDPATDHAELARAVSRFLCP